MSVDDLVFSPRELRQIAAKLRHMGERVSLVLHRVYQARLYTLADKLDTLADQYDADVKTAIERGLI